MDSISDNRQEIDNMDNNAREVVLTTLLDIEKNHTFSNIALGTALRANQFMSKQERAYITRMVEGVTEQRIRLDYIIDQYSRTKVHRCKPLIRCVLRMGTYELFFMDSVPDSAACNLCVKLAADHGFGNLRGFVNGVLRNIARNKNNIQYPDKDKDLYGYCSVKYSVPDEIIRIISRDYDEETVEKILASGYEDVPTAVRVNTDRISVEELEKKLISAGINVTRGELNNTSLLISGYDHVRRIPGFLDGEFTVQDQSSCLAVLAAGIQKGDLVVDVCAAPGGKTMYASSLTGHTGRVISRDLTENKKELIEDNIERLGIDNVTVQVHDARVPDESLVGKADVVIADLPCSGLGIMGRKNDIKYHVNMDSIDELAKLQREILDVVSQYVKPGGTLVYSTCTIDSTENESNAEWFVKNHDFEPVSLAGLVPGHDGTSGYITLVQGVDKCDGFFISKFMRVMQQ